MVRMQNRGEILARLSAFDSNPLLASLFDGIAADVGGQNLEPDEVVNRIAMPLLSYYLGDGETIIVARAQCDRLKDLLGILVDKPHASICQARFEAITAILLEE